MVAYKGRLPRTLPLRQPAAARGHLQPRRQGSHATQLRPRLQLYSYFNICRGSCNTYPWTTTPTASAPPLAATTSVHHQHLAHSSSACGSPTQQVHPRLQQQQPHQPQRANHIHTTSTLPKPAARHHHHHNPTQHAITQPRLCNSPLLVNTTRRRPRRVHQVLPSLAI